MDLSVILCTWNNSSRLRITLDSIAQCVVPKGIRWELVLVNNNSTDDTDVVAAGFDDRLPLYLVHEPTPGLSHARNMGVAVAKGDLVIFTDDDVRPYPEWLAAHWDGFRRYPQGYYFGGPLESEFEGDPPRDRLLQVAPWSVKGLDWGEQETARQGLKFVSANWSCPRCALEEIGGFDTTLGLVGGRKYSTGEESDMMRRLQMAGWYPRYLPTARLRHFVPADKCSLDHIAKRAAAHGYYRAVVLGAEGSERGASRVGVPIRLLSRLVRSWLYWARLKARRVNADVEYVYWMKTWGEVKGVFDRWRSQVAVNRGSRRPAEVKVGNG